MNKTALKKTSTKQKITLIISGLFLCVVLLEAGLRIGGFVFSFLQEVRNRIAIQQKGTYRIICLGESTTALGGEESYPHQLEEVLNQREIGVKFSVINKGRVGTYTKAIVSQLEDNLNKYSPDMVITMMGINDGNYTTAYEGIPVNKTTLFLKSFRTYKLVKLLQLHIIKKVQEIGDYKSKGNIAAQADDLTPSSIYNDQDKLPKEPIGINPNNYQAYIRLGEQYFHRAEYDKAEEMYNKAIEINPEKDAAYAGLGWCYQDCGGHDKAEEMFKKAIEINPENDQAYVGLGGYYGLKGKLGKAEEMFKKAIEINPGNGGAYTELGWHYKGQGDYDRAEEILKKAIEINPGNDVAYAGLGRCYWLKGEYDRAEEILKKATEINPEKDKAYGALAHYYQERGRHKLAEEYFRKINSLRSEYYYPITQHSYQRLKEILTKRGIKLVCVQYPVRSVELLERMFEDREGIIFVDNEGVFKEAIKQAGYDEYFTDMFGADFGHCTQEGNRLLAENIADVILKDCFNIKQ